MDLRVANHSEMKSLVGVLKDTLQFKSYREYLNRCKARNRWLEHLIIFCAFGGPAGFGPGAYYGA